MDAARPPEPASDRRWRRRGWEPVGDGWRATEAVGGRWRRLLASLECTGLTPSLEDFRFRDELALPAHERVFDRETWLVEFAAWSEDGFPADERATDLLGEWVFTEQLVALTIDDEAAGQGCSMPDPLQAAVIQRVADGEHPWVPVVDATWWGYCDALYASLFDAPRVGLHDDGDVGLPE